jgi:hypothetical protein
MGCGPFPVAHASRPGHGSDQPQVQGPQTDFQAEGAPRIFLPLPSATPRTSAARSASPATGGTRRSRNSAGRSHLVTGRKHDPGNFDEPARRAARGLTSVALCHDVARSDPRRMIIVGRLDRIPVAGATGSRTSELDGAATTAAGAAPITATAAGSARASSAAPAATGTMTIQCTISLLSSRKALCVAATRAHARTAGPVNLPRSAPSSRFH